MNLPMDLTLNSKIFYPSHGAGWIKEKRIITFNGEDREYIDFQFINDSIVISTPIEKIAGLNIRRVNNKEAIEDILEDLKNQRVDDHQCKDFSQLANKLSELDYSGKIENFIKIIQYCYFERSQRIRSIRLVPSSIDKYIKSAIIYLTGEYAVSAGIDIEEAKKFFTEKTGIEINF